MKNNKNTKGFTLIEVLLSLGVISLAGIGIYTLYDNLSLNSKIKNEIMFLNDSIENLNTVFNITQDLSGLNEINSKEFGIEIDKSKFSDVILSSNRTSATFTYQNATDDFCTRFITETQKLPNTTVYLNKVATTNAIHLIASACSMPGNNEIDVVYNKGIVVGDINNASNTATPNPATTVSSGVISVAVQAPATANNVGAITNTAQNMIASSGAWSNSAITPCTPTTCTGTNIYTSGGSTGISTINLTTATGTDVCLNIAGVQSSVPTGYTVDGSGNCITSTPPTGDFCPNIAGNQPFIPTGYVIDGTGNCVPATPPTGDICPNIVGNQATIPSGYQLDGTGSCVLASAVDMCSNIAGQQLTVPVGMTVVNGECVSSTTSTGCSTGGKINIPITTFNSINNSYTYEHTLPYYLSNNGAPAQFYLTVQTCSGMITVPNCSSSTRGSVLVAFELSCKNNVLTDTTKSNSSVLNEPGNIYRP